MAFAWLKLLKELAPAALTVRAQVLPYDDMGKLMWATFFPRVDVQSIRLADIYTSDYRPTADRREWNAPGRRVPLLSPDWREMEIIPIEAESIIDEHEMQILMERAFGNEETVRQQIMVRIPDRVQMLTMANYRRLEKDVFEAWSQGQITVRNPQNGETRVESFDFDAGRYQTASTAWNDGSVNAYTEFMAWLQDAEDTIGPVEGVMLRRATLNAIKDDAPVAETVAVTTQLRLEELITQEMGYDFKFVVNEQSVDVFDDGGNAYTRTKIWPAEKVAAIPQGMTIGGTYFAPVARAMQMVNGAPSAKIDVNGMTVFYVDENDEKELKIQAQLNALPVPDENRCYVIDAGV